MALIYHATLENLLPTVGDSELVAGNGAVVNEDHLSLPNYNSGVYPETPIALGSTYTISMWFKDLKDRSGAQGGWMMMDATSDGGGSNGNHGGSVGGYTMSIYTADELGAWDTAWRGSGYTMTQAGFTGNGWHHLVASFDNGTLTYYIDGAQVGSPVAYAGSSSIEIFGSWLNYSYGFADYMDDIRVYDNALSAGDVSTLFAGGRMALTDGLVGHWTFDDGDATASVGVDGTNSGGSFESANSRTVASFASADYIQVDDGGADFTTEDFSAAFWFYNEGASGDWAPLIGNQYGDESGNGWGWSVQRYYGNDTVFSVNTGNGGPNWSNNHSSQFTIPLNTWTHVVMTRVGTEMKIYLNGADSGFTGTSHASIGHQSDFLKIGDSITGKYDEVRLYSRALSAGDVASLYAATTVIDLTADLVAKYPLDSDVSDSLGSNDGSSHGGASFEIDGDIGAMRLTSIGDYAQIPQGLDIGSGGAYTFSVWVKPDNFDSAQVLITDHVYFETYPSIYLQLEQTTGNVSVRHYDSNSSSSQVFTSTGSLVAGQWNLVTVGWDGSNANVYLNGVLDSAGALSYTPWNASAPYRIGADTQDNLHVRGLMDDLRIWSQPLDSDAVAALYAAGADAAIAPEAPSGNTVAVTFLMQDSYGDGWNGSTFQIYDADSNIVESHTLAGGNSQTVQFDLDAEPYTWAFVNQNWMSEITATLTRDDTSEQLLFSSAGSVLSGAFDLTPPSPVISPTLAASNGEITISASLNAEATAAGATGWAYALTDIFVEGQVHGGTAMAIGADATETPTPHGVHTIYVAAIDAAGLVVVTNSASIDNSPVISIDIIKNDSYGDGWNGTMLVITNASGVEVYNATLTDAESNANQAVTYSLDLPYGTYSWLLDTSAGGNQYPNEQTVTITLNSDGTVLAHSAAHSPSNGSFTVGPPAAAISASASVSGGDITVTGTANATAVSEGAANWSASLTEFGAVGATIDGAKALTALGVDAVLTVASGGTHTVYVAVVDGSGVILAKSSVDASVFMSKIAVSDQMIVMAYLEHPSLSPQGTHAQLTNDDGDLKWGPFYIGDLTIKTAVNEVNDPSEIGTVVTFDDGSGGTLDMDGLVKEMIKKYDLNRLWGDNSADGIFFQAVLDGTNGVNPSDLLGWNGEDTHTVMLAVDGGGWAADYDTQLIANFPNTGDLMISETTPGDGVVSGPDGSSFVGIIAPGETAPAQVTGDPAKVRVKFGGGNYTTSVVIKDGNGDWFAGFANQDASYSNTYYHADLLAARDDGKLIHTGDASGHNTDGNGTPKGSAIGIMTAVDGGDAVEIEGHNYDYAMALPAGDYSVQLYAGYDQYANLPSAIYILDENDNLVAQVQSDGSGFDANYYSFTIAGAEAPAGGGGAYDWTHGGNLTNIVKFSRGSSASGVASYGYAKKEDNGTTTLYFATDLQDWETFGTYDASASGIDGNPVCMEYGPNGKVFVGTDNGKIYEVTLDGDSVPNTFVPLYTMPGGESINTAKYGVTSGEWIFEAAGKMYTIPVDGSVATERYTLPAGAKCVDIAEADDGIAMILRKADFSLEPRFALANWTNIVGPAGMSTDMTNLSATDLNYSYALDQWVASSADGTTLTTADLITFLTA